MTPIDSIARRTCARCGAPLPRDCKKFCSLACRHAPKPLIFPDDGVDVVLVPLTRGLVALVDPEDADLVSPYSWHAGHGKHTFYAWRSPRVDEINPIVQMHALIARRMGVLVVDHINGDGLDNRRANLRIATVGQNNANARKRPGAQYRGVRRLPSGRWVAQSWEKGRYLYIGSFDTAEDAARARDAVAAANYGEFARLNFPDEHATGGVAAGPVREP
jgi:hypothetical protein